MPVLHPEDRDLSHPVDEAIKALRKWKEAQPDKPKNYVLYQQMLEHATGCPECGGRMVSLSAFEKSMAGGYVINQLRLQSVTLHAIEACFGIRTKKKGFQAANGEIVPDPMFCAEQSKEFYRMFDTYIKDARRLLSYNEFIPCSLETPEFIQEHHAALFRKYEPIARAECIDLYNRIGLRQRQRLIEAGFDRPWAFWHLMLRRQLYVIANGEEEYRYVNASVRRRCLEDLLLKISDPRWKVNVVIGNAMPEEAAVYFRGLDSAVCVDDRLVFRRVYTRTIMYNTNPRFVQQYNKALESFTAHAEYREPEQSRELLRRVIAEMPRG